MCGGESKHALKERPVLRFPSVARRGKFQRVGDCDGSRVRVWLGWGRPECTSARLGRAAVPIDTARGLLSFTAILAPGRIGAGMVHDSTIAQHHDSRGRRRCWIHEFVIRIWYLVPPHLQRMVSVVKPSSNRSPSICTPQVYTNGRQGPRKTLKQR